MSHLFHSNDFKGNLRFWFENIELQSWVWEFWPYGHYLSNPVKWQQKSQNIIVSETPFSQQKLLVGSDYKLSWISSWHMVKLNRVPVLKTWLKFTTDQKWASGLAINPRKDKKDRTRKTIITLGKVQSLQSSEGAISVSHTKIRSNFLLPWWSESGFVRFSREKKAHCTKMVKTTKTYGIQSQRSKIN